jgi:hypothetical protein
MKIIYPLEINFSYKLSEKRLYAYPILFIDWNKSLKLNGHRPQRIKSTNNVIGLVDWSYKYPSF